MIIWLKLIKSILHPNYREEYYPREVKLDEKTQERSGSPDKNQSRPQPGKREGLTGLSWSQIFKKKMLVSSCGS